MLNHFPLWLHQIRDDAKNGFYVENLSEEYVTSFEDVTQILIKVCMQCLFELLPLHCLELGKHKNFLIYMYVLVSPEIWD